MGFVFSGWFGGWRRVRLMGGYSYQVSRSGARRIVRESGYSKYGERDDHWLTTGRWAEEEMKAQFKAYLPATRTLVG